jgi:hypothetical protein
MFPTTPKRCAKGAKRCATEDKFFYVKLEKHFLLNGGGSDNDCGDAGDDDGVWC